MKCLQIEREIDPVLVPKFTLYNGSKMPCIGYTTAAKGDAAGSIIKNVIRAGYRYIDCASVYGNEVYIGNAFKTIIKSSYVKREQLWIGSKVWNDMHFRVEAACKKTLSDLQLDYLDLYIVQWPFSNIPKKSGGKFVDSGSSPYNHDHFMYTWQQMERLVSLGWVKNIGTSNMTIPKLKLLLRDAKVKPVCNQMEMHPYFQQTELFNFCTENGIQPVAICPLGSFDCEENETCHSMQSVLEDKTILKIAHCLKVTPCQIAIKWAIQRGQIPITIAPNHFYEHIEAVVKVNLTEEDMGNITSIDKNNRLIKGEEFLWKPRQSWKDIWDLKGIITK